jgi:glycosyltransferase involved in cell wall biosynthesis
MAASLKILQVCSAESLGGGERHVIKLTRAMIERGHRLHLAVRRRSPLRQALANAPVEWHELGLRNALDLVSAQQLAGIVNREKIDVMHAHIARDYTFCGIAARMARPVRFFLTRHHFNPIKSNMIYEWVVAEAEALIAVSESVRGQLAAAFPKLVDRIVVIPNWVDLRGNGLSREEARSRLGIKRPLAVGIIGQLTPLKRQDLFIKAAWNLIKKKNLKDAEFLVIGEPGPNDWDYTKRLRELVEKNGIEDDVRFTGYIEGLPACLSALDIVAAVSQNEGFSLALVEAMAAGCAVIATRAGGMAEIVKEDVTGIFIEPDDEAALIEKLSGLLIDKARRESLGSAARSDVSERFDRERVIDQIERLYQGFTTENTKRHKDTKTI